jgi:hypothetical protein
MKYKKNNMTLCSMTCFTTDLYLILQNVRCKERIKNLVYSEMKYTFPGFYLS